MHWAFNLPRGIIKEKWKAELEMLGVVAVGGFW